MQYTVDPSTCMRVQTRAKAIRKHVDKMITLAKDGSLHARRQVYSPFSPIHSCCAPCDAF